MASTLSTTPYTLAQAKFVPYIPSSANPKRKPKIGLSKQTSCNTGLHKSSEGNRNINIIATSDSVLPCLSNQESPRLTGTLECSSPNEEDAVSDRVKGQCNTSDEVPVIEGEKPLTDTTEINLAAELSRDDSISVDCTIPMEEYAIIECCDSMPIDLRRVPPDIYQDINCDGDHPHEQCGESNDTDIFSAHIFDMHTHIDGMSTPDSCSSAASILMKTSERACPPLDMSTSTAKVLNSELHLQKQTAPSVHQPIPPSTVDTRILHSTADKDDGSTSSIRSQRIHNTDSHVESLQKPKTGQELLQSSSELGSPLKAADQAVGSRMTGSREKGFESDIEPDENQKREPAIHDGAKWDRYKVERIMDHDEHDGRKRLLVKWMGLPAEEMTWVPERSLGGCAELLRDYWTFMEAPKTSNNATEVEAQPPLVRDQRQEKNSCSLDRIIEIFERLTKDTQMILDSQTLLAARVIRLEASSRAASKLKQNKRKRIEEEEDDWMSRLDVGPRVERRIPKDSVRKRRRKHRKHCGRCGEAGHNTRTCENGSADDRG